MYHFRWMIRWMIGLLFICTSASCQNHANQNQENFITFAISSDYPPFEFKKSGQLIGFDVDLAKRIAQELGKEVRFKNMNFEKIESTVALKQNVDAAISSITITQKRKAYMDMSDPYYFESMAWVFRAHDAPRNPRKSEKKRIACQLGSVMYTWIHEKGFHLHNQIIEFNSIRQAVEALKAHQIDMVLMDSAQAEIFSISYPSLVYDLVTDGEYSYGILLPKNSPLTPRINRILQQLKKEGFLLKLQEKWLHHSLSHLNHSSNDSNHKNLS